MPPPQKFDGGNRSFNTLPRCLAACLVHTLKHNAIAEHFLYEHAKPDKHDCASNPATHRQGLRQMSMHLIACDCRDKQGRTEERLLRSILHLSLTSRANRRAARNPGAAVSTSHIAHYFHDLGYRTTRLQNAASPFKRIMTQRQVSLDEFATPQHTNSGSRNFHGQHADF